MPLAPSGEKASLGLGKEVTYGAAVAPTLFLVPSDINFIGSNLPLERPGARRRIGRTYPATGPFYGKANFKVEVDPDSFGAVLALAMGAEAVAPNAGNPTAAAVTTTLSNPIAGPGTQIITPAAMTNINVNSLLDIDTAGLKESVTVLAVTGSTFTAFVKQAHLAAVAIVNTPLALAYDHTFTLGSPRSFFTAEVNRVIDAVRCTGNKVSDISIAATPKSILEATVTTDYASEVFVGAPITPTYSTLYPFVFENPGNVGKINGSQSSATLLDWSVNMNTGLITDFNGFGLGRGRSQMPETMSKVTGSAKIAFETLDAYQLFWGNIGATAPQSLVSPTSFEFDYLSSDQVNHGTTSTGVAYALKVIMGSVFITGNDINIKPAGYLEQSIKFEAFETANGAADDVKFVLTNAGSGISI